MADLVRFLNNAFIMFLSLADEPLKALGTITDTISF